MNLWEVLEVFDVVQSELQCGRIVLIAVSFRCVHACHLYALKLLASDAQCRACKHGCLAREGVVLRSTCVYSIWTCLLMYLQSSS